jgi:hypothetical protein
VHDGAWIKVTISRFTVSRFAFPGFGEQEWGGVAGVRAWLYSRLPA